MNRIPLLLTLLAPLAQADSADRWVQATSLMLRAEASPTAAVVGRLQQGARVSLANPEVPAAEWCLVSAGGGMAYVACRYLSAQPVALPRAGEAGVPADRRWVAGSNLLVRAEPRPDAAVLGRLALNTVLRLTGEDAGNGYCAVQRVDGDAQSGYTACRYLQRSPLEMDKLSAPYGAGGKDNPDFDPARAFWIEPTWELMAQYARLVARQREALGDAAPKGPDEQFERMKARLSGRVIASSEPAPAWPEWETVRVQALEAGRQAQGSDEQQVAARQYAALIKALPALPPPAPSWWRAEAELAGPGESIAALATRFGGQSQWLHESLLPGSPNRGVIVPGERIERLTLPLQRISLLSNQTLKEERLRPQRGSIEWDPTADYNCPGWIGGFEHGDSDAATYARNGLGRQSPAGALTLFRFWSQRALPPGPARWTRQAFKLQRDTTGFVAGELRTVDVDGDGIADLAWLQFTGRGPGHLEGQPKHDDAWSRRLLANVGGRWRQLAEDSFGYGCGC